MPIPGATPRPGTALITGASSGIGAQLARIHAGRGGDLVLVARRLDRLQALAAELEAAHGIAVLVLAEDLADDGAPQRIYERVRAEAITVEYLCNNAGFGGLGRFDQRDWAADRAMMQVNMVALTALTRLFLPDLVARNAGRVLNVASSAALTPGPMQAVYFASKAYVRSFSNAIAEELRETAVRVTVMMPGPVDTEFGATSGMQRLDLFAHASSARVVAQEGYEAMLAGKLEIITGMTRTQRQLVRLLPFLPRRAVLRMIRKMQSE
ncbi:SDR family oxidoreductase [Novosphingobium sp. 1949]|uniref:SDR family oxidoreductase n=1 Tax=Novosphingobium organovorum TaxID=2930092 RepID=A0ABT0BBX4_9SPHN|nr:SDR family oxidoreductase [Novosphingobium organovorum]MCJ2182546.1 SDR family oxidoreductase [Novosphingobium organovorum]